MSEMIERVARAIWDQRRASAAALGIDLEEWGDGGIPKANKVFEEAGAAIKAMREPSDAMLAASHRNNHPRDLDTWQTMIDEALGKSSISPEFDKAIQDELDHPPASIMKED